MPSSKRRLGRRCQEPCRKYGTFYRWRQKYGALTKSELEAKETQRVPHQPPDGDARARGGPTTLAGRYIEAPE
jgi:hypothetical protein